MLRNMVNINITSIINGSFSVILFFIIKYGYNRLFIGRYIGEAKLEHTNSRKKVITNMILSYLIQTSLLVENIINKNYVFSIAIGLCLLLALFGLKNEYYKRINTCSVFKNAIEVNNQVFSFKNNDDTYIYQDKLVCRKNKNRIEVIIDDDIKAKITSKVRYID